MTKLSNKNKFNAKTAALTIQFDGAGYIINHDAPVSKPVTCQVTPSRYEAAFIVAQMVANTIKAMHLNDCKTIKIIAKWN